MHGPASRRRVHTSPVVSCRLWTLLPYRCFCMCPPWYGQPQHAPQLDPACLVLKGATDLNLAHMQSMSETSGSSWVSSIHASTWQWHRFQPSEQVCDSTSKCGLRTLLKHQVQQPPAVVGGGADGGKLMITRMMRMVMLMMAIMAVVMMMMVMFITR